MTESQGAVTLERASLAEAFAKEARRGVQLAVFGRFVAFALLWASFYEDALGYFHNPYFQYRTALIAVALLGGLANYLVSRRTAHPAAWCFGFLVIDLAIVGALVFGWLPPAISDYPQFLAVRQQDLLFFIVILCISVLPLSRTLVLFAGGAAAAIWMAGVALSFARTPGAVLSEDAIRGAHGWSDLLVRISRPLVLNIDYLALQAVLLAALSGLLWLGVDQGRRLVAEAVRAEGERAFLARFFPPAVARHIAGSGSAALPSARGDAAILFADFDRDQLGRNDFAALQSYYDRVEREVFEQGGVIERFAGDPVMAVFGVLPADDVDAAPPALAALRCARALLSQGGSVRPVAVGLHFGQVISGEVGSDRQKAFGVVGDSVNLARRMLDAARARGGGCVATADFARQIPSAGTCGEPVLDDAGVAAVRGLADPVAIWTLRS